MTDVYRAQIRSVLEAIHVDSSNAFYWFGTAYRPSAPLDAASLGTDQQRTMLALTLEDHLYRHFFCSGTAVPHMADWDVAAGPDSGTFAVQLSRANAGRGRWEPDWQVGVVGSTAVELSKRDLTILVTLDDCRVAGDRQLAMGQSASVRHPSGTFHRSPGFYLASGDAAMTEAAADELVRVYWNIASPGAHVLVREVTGRFNEAGVPFQLKVLDEPRSYVRCDSAVLYVAKAAYGDVMADYAAHLLGVLADHMKDSVPALTKRVAPGVSVAEDPPGKHSFGSHRCGVLARAIVASAGQELTLDERLDVVATEFRRSGIDLRAPYLNQGSRDVYGEFERTDLGPPCMTASPRRAASTSSRAVALDAAREIGALIVRTAVWHEHQCNWIGPLAPVSDASPAMRFGSRGIALFLGELSAVTDDDDVRRTAIGAIQHALARVTEAPVTEVAFYVGPLGTACVAARLGRLLGREDLAARARDVGTSLVVEPTGFDLMSGAAGRIVGLLALHDVLHDNQLLESAIAVGDRLVSSASPSDNGASWKSAHTPEGTNLTGFSHGAAGIAYALLKLFVASGHEDFRLTAEAAMEYERSWFSQGERNWPDLRQMTQYGRPIPTRLPYSTTWCHGAPGIAISRILAAEVLRDRRYADEATLALGTTRDHLRLWLDSPGANYSLCHGLAGNADVLLTGLRSARLVDVESATLIQGVADHGRSTYGGRRAPWPCGATGGGATPSLMLGWAGIGWFYLRLATPDLPSVLAP
jgi:hypothetical protein